MPMHDWEIWTDREEAFVLAGCFVRSRVRLLKVAREHAKRDGDRERANADYTLDE